MALASPPCAARTYRERLLDGSWCPSAPRHRREKPHDLASLTPRCRPRSARFGGVEGALHGSEDSPYSARIRRAPLTSQGTQRPGRRIAGRKGIPEHVVNWSSVREGDCRDVGRPVCRSDVLCAPAARITRPVLGTAHPPSPDPPWVSARAIAVPAPSWTGPPCASPRGRGPSADFLRATQTGGADKSAGAEMSAGCTDRRALTGTAPQTGERDRRQLRHDRCAALDPSRACKRGREVDLRRPARRRTDLSAERCGAPRRSPPSGALEPLLPYPQ